MEKFAKFPALNFNFSQLIRDNVEEALSGVKGANSVKLFGSDLEVLESIGQQVVNILRTVHGIENVGMFHIVGQPNLEIQIDREACAATASTWPTSRPPSRSPSAAGRSRRWSRGRSSTTSSCGCRVDLRDDPNDIARIPIDIPGPTGKPGARIPMSHVSQDHPPQAGGLVHLPREQPPLHPHQVQRRGRDLASAIAEAQRKVNDPQTGAMLPQGYRIEWSGEFAQMEAGEQAADVDRAALDRPDPGPALHGVQLDEGRPAGHGQRRRGRDGGHPGACS